jgi:hypothetical protein
LQGRKNYPTLELDICIKIIIPLRCAVQLSDCSSSESVIDESNEAADVADHDVIAKPDCKEKRFLDQLSAIQVAESHYFYGQLFLLLNSFHKFGRCEKYFAALKKIGIFLVFN